MNKRIDFTKLKGLATYQDTLAFLQESYRGAIGGIAQAFGQYVIITGVADEGANWGNGWVVIDGELMPFVGGLKADNIIIEELTDTEIFGDDSVQTVYFTKRAKNASVGGVVMTAFVRIDTIGAMNTNLTALISTVAGLAVVPTGVINPFAGAAAPAGWLLCQGQAVSRATYDALFTVIGTAYGSGDGSTTFNLPNGKGKFLVGYDAADVDYNALGKTGGEKKHTLTIGELPAHDHDIKYKKNGTDGSPNGQMLDNNGVGDGTEDGHPSGTNSFAVQNTGSGLSHENRPPFIALNYIIKI